MLYGLREHTIKAIQSVFANYANIDKAILYGSRAKGNYRNGSDIDLTLVSETLDFSTLLKIENELDDLLLPYKIDLSVFHKIENPDLVDHINRVGKVFYEKDRFKWKELKLIDLTSKIGSGATPRGGSNNYKEKGISLIRSQNVLDLQFSTEGLAFIDDTQAEELKNVIVKPKDILLNITGDSVARVCMVPDSILPARVNQHVSIIRASIKKIIPEYVLYNLISQKEELLMQSEIGATRKAITKGMIEQFSINLPPLPEQKAIASVLSSLDDKIDLLHRQNRTLEQMAETLFRQWFVEEANEDWKEGVLSDLVVVKYGKDHKKLLDGNIPVLGSGGIMRYGNTFLYDKESVLIPRKGSLNNVMYIDEPFWTVDTMFYTEMKKSNLAKFIYHFIKELDLSSMNVGSAVPSMTTEVLNNLPINIPPASFFNEFESTINPFYSKLKINQTQIRTLEKMRDTLLPKLMSGEVRVNT